MDWIITGILIAIGFYLAPIVMAIIVIAIGTVIKVIIEAINLLRGR